MYGERLRSIEVRAVKVEYEDIPFPFSFADGAESDSLYVQFSLQGSDVVIADVVSEMFGEDVLSSGIVPTKGSLASRMSQAQFDRLLAAYAAETKSPLGGVRRYNDKSEFVDPGG